MNKACLIFPEHHDQVILSAAKAMTKLIAELPDCDFASEMMMIMDTQLEIIRAKIMGHHYGTKQLDAFHEQCEAVIDSYENQENSNKIESIL